jgi:hypothetical protein
VSRFLTRSRGDKKLCKQSADRWPYTSRTQAAWIKGGRKRETHATSRRERLMPHFIEDRKVKKEDLFALKQAAYIG